MNTLVLYDSKFGNTEEVAQVVAGRLEGLGPVRVRPIASADLRLSGRVDLLVVGGPTQAHGMTVEMRAFTEALTTAALAGTQVAVFDTRFRLPVLLTGSAARAIARRLRQAGATVVAPPVSFFVTRGGEPQLETRELDRAAAWAGTLQVSLPTV